LGQTFTLPGAGLFAGSEQAGLSQKWKFKECEKLLRGYEGC
jgi:hypothetical protein